MCLAFWPTLRNRLVYLCLFGTCGREVDPCTTITHFTKGHHGVTIIPPLELSDPVPAPIQAANSKITAYAKEALELLQKSARENLLDVIRNLIGTSNRDKGRRHSDNPSPRHHPYRGRGRGGRGGRGGRRGFFREKP